MKELSKDEMKKIMGGQQVICGYWPSPDYPMALSECTGSIEACTQACNSWCNNEPGCVDNTCTCM